MYFVCVLWFSEPNATYVISGIHSRYIFLKNTSSNICAALYSISVIYFVLPYRYSLPHQWYGYSAGDFSSGGSYSHIAVLSFPPLPRHSNPVHAAVPVCCGPFWKYHYFDHECECVHLILSCFWCPFEYTSIVSVYLSVYLSVCTPYTFACWTC